MNLFIKDKVIDAPIIDILKEIRKERGYSILKEINQVSDKDVAITCPFHSNGQENNPSCYVFSDNNDSNIRYGTVHCFTCGYKASLPKFVGECFNSNYSVGEEWLYERFGSINKNKLNIMPEIPLYRYGTVKHLDESILNNYAFYHPYMWDRKLTKNVVDKFKIGFNRHTQSITFPVWDMNGNLVMVTERSVNTKHFYIPEDVIKPVYLLNFIQQENLTSVAVCESQINALTCWGWGIPAVALFGTGTPFQYSQLNKSGIRNYLLCFDGDSAGEKGKNRFIENIRNDVIVGWKQLPPGKDVNDLDKEEFLSLSVEY